MTATQRTILYIEDDPASRMLVERALKHAGYRVLVAERGLQGIDMARQESPDLILTDINLPDLTGREITTKLRSEAAFAKTPIVALTAQALHEFRDMAMAAGVTGYLTKPVDIETLPERVEFYLGGGRDLIEKDRLADAQTRYAQEIVGRLEDQIRELESTNNALQRLDKMKDTFIQLTAHELRTPLTLVYGYSRLIEDSSQVKTIIQSDPNLQVLMKGLQDGIKRMQDIINEILTISRIITNQIDLSIGLMNPGAIAERVVENLQDVLRVRPIQVHFDRRVWPEKMRGDAELLTLALTNIMNNAVKYTPDGGHIFLTASSTEQTIRISVKDTGIGVAKEEQVRIFERFHTAGDTQLHSTSKVAFRGGGRGLGLAISKGIVDAHAGRIWVESPGYDPDKLPGSEFIMELPMNTPYRRTTEVG
ncbi:MAG TPA: hybrid sensor histidine kinase/response regulator [Phototrophicaceae bacterium]|nr:hybrid sensor histidine kinase/response regulator [Phototrophicaceae bacterium]